jgi:membrane protein
LSKKRASAKERILSIPVFIRILEWAKKSSLPGFEGIPVYDVLVFLINESKQDDIRSRSNSAAFSFFLALFPTLLVAIALLPLIPFDNPVQAIQENLNTIIPASAEVFIFGTLKDLLEIERNSILSVGIILAIFFSSNGMMSLMRGFDKSFAKLFKKRKWWKARLVAIMLTALMGILLVISGVLVILGNLILNYVFDLLSVDTYTRYAIEMLKWLIVISLVYTIIATVYYVGPAYVKRGRFFSPGATLATVASLLTSVGFSFFVNSFGTYNKIYGSIGAVIVLMLWLQINSFILLTGFELNTSIAVNRDLKDEKSNSVL